MHISGYDNGDKVLACPTCGVKPKIVSTTNGIYGLVKVVCPECGRGTPYHTYMLKDARITEDDRKYVALMTGGRLYEAARTMAIEDWRRVVRSVQ